MIANVRRCARRYCELGAMLQLELVLRGTELKGREVRVRLNLSICERHARELEVERDALLSESSWRRISAVLERTGAGVADRELTELEPVDLDGRSWIETARILARLRG